MRRRFEIGIVALIFVAATLRLAVIVTLAQQSDLDLVAIRDRITRLLRKPDSPFASTTAISIRITSLQTAESFRKDVIQLRTAGVTQIAFERFDPEAVVLIGPGVDLQPGIADVDDNANGIVDDASELGATQSDDACRVERRDELDPGEEKNILILQHGAFVPASWNELSNQSRPWRAIVTGRSGDDHWSFLVEMEARGKKLKNAK